MAIKGAQLCLLLTFLPQLCLEWAYLLIDSNIIRHHSCCVAFVDAVDPSEDDLFHKRFYHPSLSYLQVGTLVVLLIVVFRDFYRI